MSKCYNYSLLFHPRHIYGSVLRTTNRVWIIQIPYGTRMKIAISNIGFLHIFDDNRIRCYYFRRGTYTVSLMTRTKVIKFRPMSLDPYVDSVTSTERPDQRGRHYN